MKFYLVTIIVVFFFSSCLKQSIPDAMLASKNSGQPGKITATLSYKVNGNAVNISVDDADNQNPGAYTLVCRKNASPNVLFYDPDNFTLEGLSNSGQIIYDFYTNTLIVGNYKYTGAYGDMFFISHNGTNEYVHTPSDSMSINITSYTSGHISGNFSGVLTPLIAAGNPDNIYGTPGSVLITNGSFQNVPVLY